LISSDPGRFLFIPVSSKSFTLEPFEHRGVVVTTSSPLSTAKTWNFRREAIIVFFSIGSAWQGPLGSNEFQEIAEDQFNVG